MACGGFIGPVGALRGPQRSASKQCNMSAIFQKTSSRHSHMQICLRNAANLRCACNLGICGHGKGPTCSNRETKHCLFTTTQHGSQLKTSLCNVKLRPSPQYAKRTKDDQGRRRTKKGPASVTFYSKYKTQRGKRSGEHKLRRGWGNR